jgi:hypothetical protein
MCAAEAVYLLIAFSFATLYNIAIRLASQGFRFPQWIEQAPPRYKAHGAVERR